MYFSLLLIRRLIPLGYVFTYSNPFIQTSKRKYLLELLKKRSEVHQKNMSDENAINLNNEKHSPKTVNQLEFFYKITENNCSLRYFAEFIQIQKA